MAKLRQVPATPVSNTDSAAHARYSPRPRHKTGGARTGRRGSLDGMDIAPLHSSDTDLVDQWLDLNERVRVADRPDDAPTSRRALRASLDHPEYGFQEETYIATENGAVVAASRLWFPLLDNTDNAIWDVIVDVEHRRNGIARTLFEHARDRSRALKRVRIIGEVRETYPGPADPAWAPTEFARSIGAQRALAEVRRRLDLSKSDVDALDKLEQQSADAAAGYHLVEWQDTAPDELMDGLVVLERRMSTDPPLGDLVWEQEAVDRDRLRGVEKQLGLLGRRAFNVGAIHDGTGEVAGVTRLVVDEDVPIQAWQWNTIVLPEHRGHRLGLLVKLANLRQLRRLSPEAIWVDTWNAEENSFMVAVNEAMGFEVREYESEWQLDI